MITTLANKNKDIAHTNKQGKTYFHLYDFAWMEFSDDSILIVRR